MKKALFAGLMFALAGALHAQVDPGRTIAVVNGQEIKGAEYYHRMEFLPGVGRNMGNSFAEFPPGFLTLEQLITEKLVFQLAKQKGVMPSEPELQQELANRKEENPKIIDQWLATGQTMDDLTNMIKFELAEFKILTAGIVVTDQEIDQFYKQNRPMFTTPKKVKLRVLVVRNDVDADLADSDLKAGKSFSDVAKLRSVDITAGVGGEYGTVPIDVLSEQVRTAILAIKVGQTTPWLKPSDARVKFLLEDIVPEAVVPMTPILRRHTRQQIMLNSGKAKNLDIKKDINALRAKAIIDIKQKEFADAYKKFIDAYLQSGG